MPDLGAVAILALLIAAPAAPPPAAKPLAASRVFVARLEAAGHASARLELRRPDPLAGGARTQKGTVALEPPDRARLDFAGGESVAMRSDGGEWLQPALGQMLRMSARHSGEARQWWSLLLPGAEGRFTERALGANRFVVIAAGEAGADSAWVTLGQDRLPSALRFRGLDGEFIEVRLSGWRFAKPRGPRAFTITAPPGVAEVELP